CMMHRICTNKEMLAPVIPKRPSVDEVKEIARHPCKPPPSPTSAAMGDACAGVVALNYRVMKRSSTSSPHPRGCWRTPALSQEFPRTRIRAAKWPASPPAQNAQKLLSLNAFSHHATPTQHGIKL